MTSFFAAFGFITLFYQIILLREVSYLFSAHEVSLSSSLAFWIFWTALGTIKIAKIRWIHQVLEKNAPAFFLLFAAALPVWLKAVRASTLLVPYGIIPDFFTMLAMGGILISVPAAMNGVCIYYLLKVRDVDFYIWETAGAVAAGLFSIAYFYAAPQIFPEKICLAFSILFAVFVFFASPRKKKLFLPAAAAVAFPALALLAFPAKTPGSAHTPYSYLESEAVGDKTVVYENGHVLAEYPDDQFEENFVTMPLLVHDNPEKILFAGANGILYLRQANKHPLKEIDVVSANRWKYEWLKKTLEIKERNTRFINEDARNFIRKSESRYDLIFVTAGNPENAAANRFYTENFMREASKNLAKNGILVFQIPSSENYLSPQMAYFSACMLKTVKSVFPEVEYIPGKKMTVLASASEMTVNPAMLRKRCRERGIKNKIYIPWNIPLLMGKFRVDWFNMRLEKVKKPTINTDFYPISYFYLWKIWLSMSASNKIVLGALFSIVMLVVMLGKTVKNIPFFAANPFVFFSFLIGFWSIVFEITLLLLYQSATGNLSWKMGILFASFMAGSAAGARSAQKSRKFQNPVLSFASAFVLTMLLIFSAELFYSLSPDLILFLSALFLILAGGAVGNYFAASAMLDGKNSYRIYALDLWGSSLGGFLASAFLMPLLGTLKTLYIILFLSGACVWPVYRTAEKARRKR